MPDLKIPDQKAETRVLLVADNHLFLNAAITFLERDEDLRVVGVNESDRDSLEEVKRLDPQIFLIDVDISNQKGVELISRLRELFPQAGIIALSPFDGDGCRRAALSAGANVVVHKLDLNVKLLPTIHFLRRNDL